MWRRSGLGFRRRALGEGASVQRREGQLRDEGAQQASLPLGAMPIASPGSALACRASRARSSQAAGIVRIHNTCARAHQYARVRTIGARISTHVCARARSHTLVLARASAHACAPSHACMPARAHANMQGHVQMQHRCTRSRCICEVSAALTSLGFGGSFDDVYLPLNRKRTPRLRDSRLGSCRKNVLKLQRGARPRCVRNLGSDNQFFLQGSIQSISCSSLSRAMR